MIHCIQLLFQLWISPCNMPWKKTNCNSWSWGAVWKSCSTPCTFKRNVKNWLQAGVWSSVSCAPLLEYKEMNASITHKKAQWSVFSDVAAKPPADKVSPSGAKPWWKNKHFSLKYPKALQPLLWAQVPHIDNQMKNLSLHTAETTAMSTQKCTHT